MKLYGGIDLGEGGIVASVRNMYLQQEILGIINDNVQGFGKIGFQRKIPVVSSFSEYIGAHALSTNVDEQVGRIKITKRPLDISIANKGYFQVQGQNGIKLTRDGRFKLDKNGYLLTLEDEKVLSREGKPIKFDSIPKELEDIKIDQDGTVKYLDKEELKVRKVDTMSVVTSEGVILTDPNIKQGYLEESNVALHEEFFNIVPTRRNFEASRQAFLIQNDTLSKALQELGRA